MRTRLPVHLWYGLTIMLLACALPHRTLGVESATDQFLVYVGTYTRGESPGIYAFRLDVASASLTPVGVVAETDNPTFLAVHPNGRFLYAANEVGTFDGQPTGAVSAFAVDIKTGRLALLNQQSSGGPGPCHLVVDQTGRNVLVANYGGGSVAVLPLGDDGRLQERSSFFQHQGSSVNPRRQSGPHAHSINLDAANRYAFAADLGLDQVLIYRFDPDRGVLQPNDPASLALKPGTGPRHFTFHPNGRFAYVINELDSTITACRYDPDRGALEQLQTLSTLPLGFEGRNSTAEIRIHPTGKFLYGSNRGHDSLAICSVDGQTGRLTVVGHESTQGKTPRNFAIDPTGTVLLAENQASNSIVVFRINADSGRLAATGQVAEVPSPVCIRFVAVR